MGKIDLSALKVAQPSKRRKTFLSAMTPEARAAVFDLRRMAQSGETTWSRIQLREFAAKELGAKVSQTRFSEFLSDDGTQFPEAADGENKKTKPGRS